MTIAQALDTVDRLTANQVDAGHKVAWLSTLDGTVHQEILAPHGAAGTFPGYPPGTDMDTVLLVPPPYDVVYRWYLEMLIHDANGEMTRYNNAAEKYNAALLAYADYVNRTTPVAQATPLGLV